MLLKRWLNHAVSNQGDYFIGKNLTFYLIFLLQNAEDKIIKTDKSLG